MKNKTKKLLIAFCSAVSVFALASCRLTGANSASDTAPEQSASEAGSETLECTHVFADEYTCHDRACTVDGCDYVEAATTEHVYADEYTCHDRTCGCGYVSEATTEHTYGEWITIRDAECESEGLAKRTCDCGEEEENSIQETGHSYADDYTCHDRTCIEGCGYVKPASTAHNYLGDWETVTEASCQAKGEESRTCECGYVATRDIVKNHEFDADGVCTMCEKNVKEMFITVEAGENVAVKLSSGTYEITSMDDANAYATIPGNILTALKDMGYTTLSFTVTNPAEGLCDNTSKCKSFFIAAGSTANLWNANTAIAYWDWKPFWDNGKMITFTVDVATYAGQDLYVYTGNCDVYPTVIQIAEFIDNEDPSTFLLTNNNATVEYVEGKGWHIAAVDDTKGYYAKISANVVQHYITNGCNFLKVSFANSLGLEGVTNEGNLVNTEAAILPEKAGGGNDWLYFNGFISQKAVLDKETGEFYTYIDLTSAGHDYTKDIEIYFKNTDVAGNKVGHAYISGLEFIEHTECQYTWATTTEGDCVTPAVETGTCVVCKATTTRDGVLNHNIGADDKCTGCGKTYRELLIVPGDTSNTDTIALSPAKGLWEVTSTDLNSYVKMDGNMLKELVELGYAKLTVTVTNPAPGLYDNNDKGKSCFIAADSTANLWSADTAIAFYEWKTFWDNGKTFTVEIDLNTYAGRDIYIFSDKCNSYATQIVVNELIDLEHPEAILLANTNGAVEYVEGKGWHVSAVDGANAYYTSISATVVQHYIAKGYTTLKISFVNNFNIGITTVGNPVNVTCAILPEKAAGGNDWGYNNSFISQKTYDEGSNSYYVVIDLTDANHDFTKDIELYFTYTDVAENAVGHTYISGLEFGKTETTENA